MSNYHWYLKYSIMYKEQVSDIHWSIDRSLCLRVFTKGMSRIILINAKLKMDNTTNILFIGNTISVEE